MYLDQYFSSVDKVFSTIRETQLEAIHRGAEAIAESLAKKGAWYVMDTGHLLSGEAFSRAGGLAALRPFKYELKIEDSVVGDRKQEEAWEGTAEVESRLVSMVLDRSSIQEGDVLQIGSNSGRTPNTIEVALQCKTRGHYHHRPFLKRPDGGMRSGPL